MISIILATARPSTGAIEAWPERDHLEYTLAHLDEQDYTDFEVIISDALYGTQFREIGALRRAAAKLGRPVYHVPVETPWLKLGHPAISAGRNSGIAYASGELLVFLDDLSAPEPHVLPAYFDWFKQGYFLNAFHGWLNGDRVDEAVTDHRLALLQGQTFLVDHFDLNGYASASLKAMFAVNGFDEVFDGSRQLEDVDLSHRLKKAGFHLVLDRRVTVREQRARGRGDYNDPASWKEAGGSTCSPTGAAFTTPRCNGTWLFGKVLRQFSEVEANRRDFTDEERGWYKPCRFLKDARYCGMLAPGTMCNFVRADGSHEHDSLGPEYAHTPVFDLRERWKAAQLVKEQYRLR